MRSAITAKRKGDGIISIKQDNAEKTIEIEMLNKAAEKITGRSSSELAGANFNNILPHRIKETLDGYIEFDDENSDFAHIARKIPNFMLLNNLGQEIPISLKVFQVVSTESNKLQYELLVRDTSLIKHIKELKDRLSEKQDEEAVDAQTGLNSFPMFRDSLETSYHFVEENNNMEISLAIVAVDHLDQFEEKYGEKAAYSLVRHVGEKIIKICRTEDITAHIGEGDIGVILVDCNTEDAKSVLNRVNEALKKDPFDLSNKLQMEISLSIGYKQLSTALDIPETFERCVDKIINLQDNGGNKMQEA